VISRFNYENIDYIEACGVRSKVYNKTEGIFVKNTIASLEQILPKEIFRRVHKSYIINLSKIIGFNHKEFLIDGLQIPIGVSYKPRLEDLFNDFRL
jgi:DNA-binding LytR/AlgR family response regulator